MSKKGTLYVRGVTLANIQFLKKLASRSNEELGTSDRGCVGRVLNNILNNMRAQEKEKRNRQLPHYRRK